MSSGTAVYRGMTQEELNRQYDQRTLVPDFATLFAQWRTASAAAAERIGQPLRLDYGEDPQHYLDVYAAKGQVRGLHVHYHGGAWKALGSSDCWWLAEPWIEAGYHFAAANFSLVPDRRLESVVDEARVALETLPGQVASAGLTPGGGEYVISGHSSGAHLAALAMLAGNELALHVAPERCCVILASGIYDLEPVQLSSRNSYLGLTPEEALSFSPIRHLRPSAARVVVVWSRNELGEFQRQSRELADALTRLGMAVAARPSEAATHFETWGEILPGLLDAPTCDQPATERGAARPGPPR